MNFQDEHIFAQIFAVIFRAQRNIVRKFARIRTKGGLKICRNITELSYQAKFHQKALKSQEIRRNSDRRLLDNTVNLSYP